MCGGMYRGLSEVAGVMGGGLWCPLTLTWSLIYSDIQIYIQTFYMPPLRCTPTLANLNDENQPEKINLPTLSLPASATDPPYVIDTCPSIFKPPLAPPMTTLASLHRQSSLLGRHQYLLPGRPIFPPSVRKPNLYHQALKKFHRQVLQELKASGQKRHILSFK